jgi:hypothetical protein
MTGPKQSVVDLVLERDRWSCVRCGVAITGARGVSWSIHHRRPRGMGGSREPWVNLPANLLTICGDATSPLGCHSWIESHRVFARASGWLVPLNGVALPSSVPVHHSIHGVVILDDLGGITNQEVPW